MVKMPYAGICTASHEEYGEDAIRRDMHSLSRSRGVHAFYSTVHETDDGPKRLSA
jgi:hypothetical protein